MIYSICKSIAWVLARLLFRFKAYHVERVPPTGGGVLAPNHASFMDPPLSGIALPRKLYFFARNTLMKQKLSRWFFTQLHCIPVNRENLDLHTYRQVVDLVKKGEMMTIFPEGTRSEDGNLQEGMIGIGMIVHHAKAPVVPCYISGAAAALPRGARFFRPTQVRVIYGEPLDFSNLPVRGDKREAYAQISHQIMQAIARLKEELEGIIGK